MSLINDALKRARQAQRESVAAPPADLRFRPADPSQQRSYSPPALLLAALAVVLVLGGLLLLFIWQKSSPSPQAVNASQPVTSSAQPATSAVAPSPPSARASSVNPAAPATEATSPRPVAATPPDSTATPAEAATNIVTAVAAVGPPKPAAPKLQGIAYHPARPTAVVNGKTVFIGSRVGEFRVLSITKETVTIGSGSLTNVLRMDE